MPLNIEKLLAADIGPIPASWDADKVILYHLGLGAGVPPTDQGELSYTYERGLKVLPAFAVLPAQTSLGMLIMDKGYGIELPKILHAEQDLEVRGPLPAKAEVNTTARVAGVYDKTKFALVVLETTTRDAEGNELFVNRFSLFVRGEGGFGGESGPPAPRDAPDREPDVVRDCPTLPQQALLYRLNGDKNPLHADPKFAAAAGFDAPILHGLCSYGMVCKAVVDGCLDGDVSRVARYQARMAGTVTPGETLTVQMWREDDRVLVRALVKERGTPAITHSAVTLR